MIRRRCEEIENIDTKKINNYKTQISELSAKAESHINLEEKSIELSSKNEKQQTVLAAKTKEINNLKQQIVISDNKLKDVENNCKDLQSKLSIARESYKYEREHKIRVTLENALSRLDKPINVVPSTADHQDELIVLPSTDETITIEKCEDEQIAISNTPTLVNTNEEVSKSINTKVNSTIDASPVNEISKRVTQLHNREEQIEVHKTSIVSIYNKKASRKKWTYVNGSF